MDQSRGATPPRYYCTVLLVANCCTGADSIIIMTLAQASPIRQE